MKKIFVLFILVAGHFFANSQNKKIINDYQELVSALVSIKSEAEQYASEVKSAWATDSFMVDAKVKYANLKAAVDGIIASFQTIIRKPNLISSSVQKGIDSSLTQIKAKFEAFRSAYIKGATAKTGGGGFSAIINPIAMLQSGANLYIQIRNIISGTRDTRAKEFKETCALLSWMDLP